MKKYKKYICIIVLNIFILLPAVSFSAGLVPCDGVTCGFSDLILLAYKLIKFVVFTLFLPVAAILFAYAGFLFMTAGGSEENVGKAKKIFWHVLLGLIMCLAAWLIVKLVLIVMGIKTGYSLLEGVGK